MYNINIPQYKSNGVITNSSGENKRSFCPFQPFGSDSSSLSESKPGQLATIAWKYSTALRLNKTDSLMGDQMEQHLCRSLRSKPWRGNQETFPVNEHFCRSVVLGKGPGNSAAQIMASHTTWLKVEENTKREKGGTTYKVWIFFLFSFKNNRSKLTGPFPTF